MRVDATIQAEDLRQSGALQRDVLKFKNELEVKYADFDYEIKNGPIDDDGRDRRQISASVPFKDIPVKAKQQILEQIGVDIDEEEIKEDESLELADQLALKSAGQRKTPAGNAQKQP